MKFYVEMSYLKNEDVDKLVHAFPNDTFSSDLENSLDAEAIISMPGFLTSTHLDRFSNLSWVFVLTAGYDTLNLDYFKQRNIVLTNAKDVFSIQIAEDVFAKILYVNRNYQKYQEQMLTGSWKHHPVTHEIAESHVGIIGTGSIGIEVAKRMKAFGAKTLGYRKTNERVPFIDELYTTKEGLDNIYRMSDYLVISIPLDASTKKLIDQQAFSIMKKDVLLVNVARGDIIDQDAMVIAMKNQTIRGALLDVTSPEPLPENHELWRLPNVFITPHNSSSSPHVRRRLIEVVIKTIHVLKNSKNYDNRIV